jgi:hypothetical protein
VAKPVKIVVWVLVFALAAGAGAYMASRANPFPPGVEDPGARPSPSTSAAPHRVAWRFVMTSRSWHDLHQGGTCRSDWRTKGWVVVRPNGEATGSATATVLPGAGCTFTQSQVQLKGVQMDVSGIQEGATLRLTFDEVARTPFGAQDLGGFVETLSLVHPLVKLGSAVGHGFAKASKPDGDLGTYGSKHELQLMMQ